MRKLLKIISSIMICTIITGCNAQQNISEESSAEVLPDTTSVPQSEKMINTDDVEFGYKPAVKVSGATYRLFVELEDIEIFVSLRILPSDERLQQ